MKIPRQNTKSISLYHSALYEAGIKEDDPFKNHAFLKSDFMAIFYLLIKTTITVSQVSVIKDQYSGVEMKPTLYRRG